MRGGVILPSGLSPRVRGNPLPPSIASATLGSIPACAGEPVFRRAGHGRCRVYPRVCGGTIIGTAAIMTAIGLSPRVRGNPGPLQPFRGVQGSIPACAGEPPLPRQADRLPEVYPRVCGGTGHYGDDVAGGVGLSPRVRGNRRGTLRRRSSARSIPACAGEPACLLLPSAPAAVYPRVCGGTSVTLSWM